MDAVTFEGLLHEPESTSLDFKQAQYSFVGADDRAKSELLKDILAFANSWRRTTAYILIGVREVTGGRADLVGIDKSDSLDDASLQQFVNTKTHQQIQFQYEAFRFEGLLFGVISIPVQKRPVYCRKDFGKLKANVVYHRSGSSTAEASPDDIAKMGLDTRYPEGPPQPTLTLELADLRNKTVLGEMIKVSTTHNSLGDVEELPDAGDGGFIQSYGPDRVNTDYWRELAEWKLLHDLSVPIGFVLKNTSTTIAQNPRFVITITKRDNLLIVSDEDMPTRPQYRGFDFPILSVAERFGGITERVSVEEFSDRYEITTQIRSIQPQASAFSPDPFYMALNTSGSVVLDGILYADNISEPVEFKRSIEFELSSGVDLTIDALQDLHDSFRDD